MKVYVDKIAEEVNHPWTVSVITFGMKNWGNSPSKELVSGYPNHTLLAISF